MAELFILFTETFLPWFKTKLQIRKWHLLVVTAWKVSWAKWHNSFMLHLHKTSLSQPCKREKKVRMEQIKRESQNVNIIAFNMNKFQFNFWLLFSVEWLPHSALLQKLVGKKTEEVTLRHFVHFVRWRTFWLENGQTIFRTKQSDDNERRERCLKMNKWKTIHWNHRKGEEQGRRNKMENWRQRERERKSKIAENQQRKNKKLNEKRRKK